jgi:hypothetical protein
MATHAHILGTSLAVLVLATASMFACPAPQPGCTRENCEAMIQACRVEFLGMPAEVATCTGFDRPSAPPDWAKYCVDACNASAGNGDIASCIAAKADACRDAGVDTYAIVSACFPSNKEDPEPSCADRCATERKACDTRCSGGKPCDLCLRMGGSCASVCTDAGWSACLDCSAQCGIQFVRCQDACPRVQ